MLERKNEERQELNQLMFNEDSFFNEFNLLDNKTYAENIIPKKYKELMGLMRVE